MLRLPVLHPISVKPGSSDDEYDLLVPARRPILSDEARPIVRDIYLRVVRDSLWNGTRREALRGLQRMVDPSVISELQEIANSPDAEVIEAELAKTIAHLQGKPKAPEDQIFYPGGSLFP